MTERKLARKTTQALIQAVAARFQADVQAIANMAVDDGEAPPGSNLDLNNGPACWVIETPDIQPKPDAPLPTEKEG